MAAPNSNTNTHANTNTNTNTNPHPHPNQGVPCSVCGAPGVCHHKYSHIRYHAIGVQGPLFQPDNDFGPSEAEWNTPIEQERKEQRNQPGRPSDGNEGQHSHRSMGGTNDGGVQARPPLPPPAPSRSSSDGGQDEKSLIGSPLSTSNGSNKSYCSRCLKQHRACDEVQPVCGLCARSGQPCLWPPYPMSLAGLEQFETEGGVCQPSRPGYPVPEGP
jgi:hypothetical protein